MALINYYLFLEDGSTFLDLGDGASFLLIGTEEGAVTIDHQWDGKIIPTENVTIATHITTGHTYLVTKLIRYNRRPPREYQYACHVLNQVNGRAGKADVWYDIASESWKCDTYVQVSFRDEDGVKKNM